MPTYVQKDIASDVSPYLTGNREMSAGAATDGSFVVSLGTIEIFEEHGFITPSGVPNNDGWESGGTFTVEVEMDVGNHSIDGSVRIDRIDSGGSIIQSGSYTATQAMNANRTFSPVAPTWTGGEEACDNRLGVVIKFEHATGMGHSCTVGLGTTANETVTDVTEDASGCVSQTAAPHMIGYRRRRVC